MRYAGRRYSLPVVAAVRHLSPDDNHHLHHRSTDIDWVVEGSPTHLPAPWFRRKMKSA